MSIVEEIGNSERLGSICTRHTFKYFGHIRRRENNNLERLVMIRKTEGRRPRGRSSMKWTDRIGDTCEKPVHVVARKVADGEKWRSYVATLPVYDRIDRNFKKKNTYGTQIGK